MDRDQPDAFRVFYEYYSHDDERGCRVYKTAYEDFSFIKHVNDWLTDLEADHAVEFEQLHAQYPYVKKETMTYDRTLKEIVMIKVVPEGLFRADENKVKEKVEAHRLAVSRAKADASKKQRETEMASLHALLKKYPEAINRSEGQSC